MRIKTFLSVIHNSRGLTLVELLATLAIMTMVIGLVWTMVFQVSTQSETTADHTQLRQEASIIISELKQKHQAEAGIICYEDGELRDGESPLHESSFTVTDVRIDNAAMALEAEGTCFEAPLDRAEAVDISFTLRADDSEQHLTYDVDTALSPDSTADEIAPPDNLPAQNGNGSDSLADSVREDDLFTAANRLELNGSSVLTGREGTVVIQEEYNGTDASITMVEAAEIYIDAPEIEMQNHAIGNEDGPMSELYINGDISVSGGSADRPRLLGNLLLDGTLNVVDHLIPEEMVTGTITETNEITFPVNDTGSFRSDSWYEDNGYTDEAISDGNNRYFGGSISVSGGEEYENIHAVSTGDIELAGNVNADGILYAPDGTVEIAGSSAFAGIIIADEIKVSGNAAVTYKAPDTGEELPFR